MLESYIRSFLREAEARILHRVEQLVASRLATLFLHTTLATTSETKPGAPRNPFCDSISGWATGGEEQAGTPDGARVELAGLCVVPLPGEPALVMNHGPQPYLIPLGSTRYRPREVLAGDAVLYCLSQKQGTIRIQASDGKITIQTGDAAVILTQDGQITLGSSKGRASMEKDRLSVNSDIDCALLLHTGNPPVASTLSQDVTLVKLKRGTDAGFTVEFTVVKEAVGPLLIVNFTRPYPKVPVAALVQNGSAEKVSVEPTGQNVILSSTKLPVGKYEMTVLIAGVA